MAFFSFSVMILGVALCAGKVPTPHVTVREGFLPHQQLDRDCTTLCGNDATPYQTCTQPPNCSTSSPGCGCTCTACGSCVVATNPNFTKVCQANVVLVLDNSYSILYFDAVQSVVTGAQSFWNNFAQVNQIGGIARLAVVQFSTDSEIVNAGQTNMFEMKTLDADWLARLNRFIDPTIPKSSPLSTYNPHVSCTQPSCTNWGAALKTVQTTPWCVTDVASGTCVPTQPDIVLWFTDGTPTTHDGTCDWDCNANRPLANGSGVLGPNKGGDLGVGCYYADLIKESSTKVFLVGVGQASTPTAEANIQIVTGLKVWNQSNPLAFATSDYIISANYTELGAIFFSVARGICRCLQDQEPCQNFVAPPAATITYPTCPQQEYFDARLRVTTNIGSTIYPPNSRNFGYIYYSFGRKPPVYAVELQTPGGNFTTNTGVIKTDVFDPCSVSRKEVCADQCFSVAEQSFLPRFFLAAGDAPYTGPFSGLNSSCGVLYLKNTASLTIAAGESIEYLWIRTVNNTAVLCAARAFDGTLYEFFQDNAGTIPGVNYRVPIHISIGTDPFRFEDFDNCPARGKCSSTVDLLYVIDRQFTSDDYVNVQNYITQLLNTYNTSAQNVRAAIVYSDPSISSNAFTSNFDALELVVNSIPAQPGQSPNFYSLLTTAIDKFWPNTPVSGLDPPRFLLTVVGGPDAMGDWTAQQQADFNALKSTRKVESWVVGVAQGAKQVALVNNIGDHVPYDHVQFLGTSETLQFTVVDQGVRMCPTQSLCPATCKGLCVCGQCLCPDCITPDPTNLCQQACCDPQSQLCTIRDKELTPAPLGCVPENRNPCTKYSCVPDTGACAVDTTCAAGCGCNSTSKCKVNRVNTANCAASCDLSDLVCGCGNLCGASCDEATGLCTGAKNCSDSNACTADSCIVALAGTPPVPTAVCQHTDLSASKCPNNNVCATTVCEPFGPTEFRCVQKNITALIDFCGTCLGNNSLCFFQVPESATGPIIGGMFAAGFGIAAIAAAIAGLLAFQQKKTPEAINPLGAQALNDNPAFVTPGIVGEMPAA
jgi:hypothetical protein